MGINHDYHKLSQTNHIIPNKLTKKQAGGVCHRDGGHGEGGGAQGGG
jgi:hypothetical protein